jgi:hypothetical protein
MTYGMVKDADSINDANYINTKEILIDTFYINSTAEENDKIPITSYNQNTLYIWDKDFNSNLLFLGLDGTKSVVGTSEIGLTPVSSVTAVEGIIYYDSDDNKFYGRDNDSWIEFGGGGGGDVSFSDTTSIIGTKYDADTLADGVYTALEDVPDIASTPEMGQITLWADANTIQGTSTFKLYGGVFINDNPSQFNDTTEFNDSIRCPYLEDLEGDEQWAFFTSTTALAADSMAEAGMGLIDHLPPIEEIMMNTRFGEITWPYLTKSGKMEYDYDLKGRPSETIWKLQYRIEHAYRYILELEIEKDALQDQVTQLEERVLEIEKTLNMTEQKRRTKK